LHRAANPTTGDRVAQVHGDGVALRWRTAPTHVHAEIELLSGQSKSRGIARVLHLMTADERSPCDSPNDDQRMHVVLLVAPHIQKARPFGAHPFVAVARVKIRFNFDINWICPRMRAVTPMMPAARAATNPPPGRSRGRRGDALR
jgi:hypothetical protein